MEEEDAGHLHDEGVEGVVGVASGGEDELGLAEHRYHPQVHALVAGSHHPRGSRTDPRKKVSSAWLDVRYPVCLTSISNPGIGLGCL